MSCKSLLYTALTADTVVAAEGLVPVGNLIRRFGRAIQLDGNNINLTEPGYYNISMNMTVLPTSSAAISAEILENGIPVSGSKTTATPTAASASTLLTIPSSTVRVYCYSTKSIAIQLSATGTVRNMSLTITKE